MGVLIALAAAVCWSFATVLMFQDVQEVPIASANVIRTTFVTMLLWAAVGLNVTQTDVGGHLRKLGRRNLLMIAFAGVAGVGSSVTFLSALALIGPGKAATLSSTAPLFAAPMAALFFKERLTPRTVIGTRSRGARRVVRRVLADFVAQCAPRAAIM